MNQEKTIKVASIVGSIVDGLLWVTLALALAASFNHVAGAFNSLENSGDEWVGYAAAASVDLALAALAYVRQRRRAANIKVGLMTLGLIFFSAISMLANVWHGIDVMAGGQKISTEILLSLNAFDYVRVMALSATLPLILLYLGEIVSVPGSKSLLKDLIDQVQELSAALQGSESVVKGLETKLKASATRLQSAATRANDAGALRKAAESREQKLKLTDGRLQAQIKQLQAELDKTREAARLFDVLSPVVHDVARMKAGENLTQAQIADKHSVSPSYVSRVRSYTNGAEKRK